MAQSRNTRADLAMPAAFLGALDSYGQIMIGDKAFEFYSDRNPEHNIQIPWEDIDYIAASVYFKRWIPRFLIHTKNNVNYIFSARHARKLLTHVKDYVPADRLVHSLTIMQTLQRRLKRTKKA